MGDYLVKRGDQETGPFTKSQIAAQVRRKELSMADSAKEIGLPEWRQVSDLFVPVTGSYAIADGPSAIEQIRRAPNWLIQFLSLIAGLAAIFVTYYAIRRLIG